MFDKLIKTVLDKVGVSEGEVKSKLNEAEKSFTDMANSVKREAMNTINDVKNEAAESVMKTAEEKMTDGKGFKNAAMEKFLMVEEAKEANMNYNEYIKLSYEERAEKLGMTLENYNKRREVTSDTVENINTNGGDK